MRFGCHTNVVPAEAGARGFISAYGKRKENGSWSFGTESFLIKKNRGGELDSKGWNS